MTPEETPKLVFVGGTGRSGTHVVANLVGRHSRFGVVPIECRFHCNENGLSDLVQGRTTSERFLKKLKGFWWRRIRLGDTVRTKNFWMARGKGNDRGLYKIVPKKRLRKAVREFERTHGDDLEGASRKLFEDLLRPVIEPSGKPGMVEMSCFTIAAAPGLAKIFPEAKFIHTVRDGRDTGSSKVGKRRKSDHPTTVGEGIRWWQGRLDLIERGVRELGENDRLLTISLDDLVSGNREETYARILEFLGLEDEPEIRSYFDERMNATNAHKERWREGLTEAEQAEVVAQYETALDRLESEGYHCAGILRAAYERASQPVS